MSKKGDFMAKKNAEKAKASQEIIDRDFREVEDLVEEAADDQLEVESEESEAKAKPNLRLGQRLKPNLRLGQRQNLNLRPLITKLPRMQLSVT